jgi:disulfide bond formation protein DsbB
LQPTFFKKGRAMLNLNLNDPRRIALLVTLAAAATISGAWGFELLGYAPCELCLQQRWAYYVGVPLSALAAAALAARWTRLGAMGLALVAALFLGSAIFGAWHAGVEWRLWAGPNGCTGAFTKASDASDFLRQLETTRLVRCDEVAIRILGLSLAGWNAVVSLGLSALAAMGARAALAGD